MYTVQDGLGSVRAEIAANADITARGAYEPYGLPTDVEGAYSQPFRFTGEMLDANALQYHRARYYNAGMSGWVSLDPFEGMADRAMSLNGYSWVEGNVVNGVDPSGLMCQPLWAIQAGGPHFDLWRSSTCYDLQKILKEGARPPTYREVSDCYDCGILAPLASVEAYRQGLLQAVADGMITSPQFDALVQAYIPEYDLSGNVENIFYGDTGYLEGISGGGIIS